MPNNKRSFSQREEQPGTPPRILPPIHSGILPITPQQHKEDLFKIPSPCLDLINMGQSKEKLTQDKALDSLFSESSLKAYKQKERTSSFKYYSEMNQRPRKKIRPFVSFDSKIGKNALFHRYSLTELQALLTPLSEEEKNKISNFELMFNKHQSNPLKTAITNLKKYNDSLNEINSQKSYQSFKAMFECGINDDTSISDSLHHLKNFLKSANEAIDGEIKRSHGYNNDYFKEIAQYFLRQTIEQYIQKQKGLDFRFVVIDNHGKNEILFSLGTSSDTMSHSQLVCKKEESSECLAAGDIHFEYVENSHPKIAAISNRTGHFKCAPSTLLFPVSCLLTLPPFWLGEQIEFNLLHPKREYFSTIDVIKLKSLYCEKIGEATADNKMPKEHEGVHSLGFFSQQFSNPEQPPRPRFPDNIVHQPELSRFVLDSGSESEEEKDNSPGPCRY